MFYPLFKQKITDYKIILYRSDSHHQNNMMCILFKIYRYPYTSINRAFCANISISDNWSGKREISIGLHNTVWLESLLTVNF